MYICTYLYRKLVLVNREELRNKNFVWRVMLSTDCGMGYLCSEIGKSLMKKSERNGFGGVREAAEITSTLASL